MIPVTRATLRSSVVMFVGETGLCGLLDLCSTSMCKIPSGPFRAAALSDRWRIKKGGKDRSNMTVTVFQRKRFNGPEVPYK